MNQELLCRWLGVPAQPWPPDHYALLGVTPGEGDLLRLERQVQERMAKLRCYQLSHPEEATEGMNRLAQAFITLTEAASKAPPAQIGPAPKAPAHVNGKNKPPKPATKVARKDDTATIERTRVDWRATPPPVRGSSGSNPSIPVAKPATPPPPTISAATIDVVAAELGQRSDEAISGLGTWATLIDRVDRTRSLLTAWQRLGLLLRHKDLTHDAELTRLTGNLDLIREAMERYPRFVGHPGKPGYRVVAMARLSMNGAMYRMLTTTQRDDLLRDWTAGHQVLLAHRRFLRSEFKAMRRKGTLGLFLRAVSAILSDYALYWGAGAIAVVVLVILIRLFVW